MNGTIRIIGVPIDLGQSKRGVDMGPAAVRYAGLTRELEQLGYTVLDSGNIAVPIRETVAHEGGQHYLPSISGVCGAVYEAARQARHRGELPLFIGGDHTLAIGSIGGITHEGPVGLIWIDAHADFNTPRTTLSGNIHGMTLATLMGDGYDELIATGRPGAKLAAEDVVMIGIRELDPGERNRLRGSGIAVFTMRDIDERGMNTVARDTLERLEHLTTLHVSLDLDALDPLAAPGVGTAVSGGITCREAQLLMEILADSGRCRSLDLVEINPVIDRSNRTALLAVQLAASLFGKRII